MMIFRSTWPKQARPNISSIAAKNQTLPNFIDSLAVLPVIAPADSSTIKLRADWVGLSLPSFEIRGTAPRN